MERPLKTFLKQGFLQFHKACLRLGLFLLPAHYYTPLPNILELARKRRLWAHRSSLPGIQVDLNEQLQTLTRVCRPYAHEYVGNRIFLEAMERRVGPGFGFIEAQALHGFLRFYKPRRIIEVGSGVSTFCMLAALKMNRQEGAAESHLTCIEPHPSPALRATPQIRLWPQEVQAVPPEVFQRLRAGDFLFIDSSHAVKAGGDVNYLVLEVLPRLGPGVFVHIHDVNFPYDYPRDVLQTFCPATEPSLVRAFLIHNSRAKMLFCLSHLHYQRQAELREIFPDYDPQDDDDGMSPYPPFRAVKHFAASLYLEMR